MNQATRETPVFVLAIHERGVTQLLTADQLTDPQKAYLSKYADFFSEGMKITDTEVVYWVPSEQESYLWDLNHRQKYEFDKLVTGGVAVRLKFVTLVALEGRSPYETLDQVPNFSLDLTSNSGHRGVIQFKVITNIGVDHKHLGGEQVWKSSASEIRGFLKAQGWNLSQSVPLATFQQQVRTLFSHLRQAGDPNYTGRLYAGCASAVAKFSLRPDIEVMLYRRVSKTAALKEHARMAKGLGVVNREHVAVFVSAWSGANLNCTFKDRRVLENLILDKFVENWPLYKDVVDFSLFKEDVVPQTLEEVSACMTCITR